MKRGRAIKGATIGAAALGTIVLPAGLSEAQSNQTEVRFVHAVAGAGPAALVVEQGEAKLPSAFAKPSGYQIYHPGATRLSLILDGQSKPVATEKVRLGPGKYTVVAIGGKSGVDLLVYKDDGVQSGKATLRAIHAAAEVGKADVRLDGKVVLTGVGLGDASGYLPVPPGRHTVAITRPGGKGGALVKANLRAVPGTASSAIVVGSAGMPAQIVLTNDGSAGPQAAPATGLGGATTDGNWLLILGASLLGGTIGGATYFLSRRVRTRGAMVVSPAAEAEEAPKSFVAAGPPVAPKQIEDEAPAAEPVAALVGAMAGNGNGHGNGNGNGGPTLWTPPPGERWLSDPAPVFSNGAGEQSVISSGRFLRPDPETPDAPRLPRFIIPDDLVKPPTPRFIRPEPADVAEIPAADEVTSFVEAPETTPEVAPVEAAVPPQSEQILSAGPTPRLGETEASTPRPTPFWERSDQPTQPLQPAVQEPEAVEAEAVVEPEAPAAPEVEPTAVEVIETPAVVEPEAHVEPEAPVDAEPEPETEAPTVETEALTVEAEVMPLPFPAHEPEVAEVPEIVEPEPAAEAPVYVAPVDLDPSAPRLRALKPVERPTEAAETFIDWAPRPAPETVPEPVEAEEAPLPVIDWTPEPVVEVVPAPEPAPEPVIEAMPEPDPVQAPAIDWTPEPAAEATPEPVVEPEPEPEPEPELTVVPEPEPEPAPHLHAVPDAEPAPSNTSSTGSAVSTWSSASAKRTASHSTAHDVAGKVNFLVVSGAALVVTGLVVARRGGRR